MKFHNGCWLLKEHYARFSPSEAYYTHINDTSVVFCAPTSVIRGKGDMLEGINLTVRITSPAPEILRVETCHFAGVQKKTPEFELFSDGKPYEEQKLDVYETEHEVTVRSGKLSLVINKKPWSMTYYSDGKKLTASAPGDLACMKTDWKGYAYDTPDNTYIREQLSIGVGELLYGTGERFTPFVKNGQTVIIRNEDGGTSTSQSYKNIPFYISNKGYGVFVNHPETVEFELGTEFVTKAGFSVAGEKLDYFVINGPEMKDVLTNYTGLTGRPALPAPWTFGLWLSTSFTTNYDEDTVMYFIDEMDRRGIPLKVFHFDCCWMKDFCWTDLCWDSKIFPDPQGMLKRIREKGKKICVWINPYIAQESVLFAEGAEKGYFIKRKNGDVWQWDMWQPGMAIVDFTNPAATEWFCGKLETLLDMGVDCFKTDFGERIPVDCAYFDGSDPEKMHNYYTYLYNKAVYELIERKRGTKEAVLFARSATVGGQKFPVHWGGDCWSDYESMEESLRGGLSFTMSGFGFWSHDIGGFENTSTPDVYKRWAAFGLLSSHSRLHGSSSYRVPWAYDEEAVDVVRFFTKLKASLMPYLYSMAVNASKTGVPMMRSMVLEFTGDKNCGYLDKQYMMGDSLLVAPVFNDESLGSFYLPEGTWTDFFTGETKQGGRWYEEKTGYCSIPLYVRPNSIVAVGSQNTDAVYDYANGAKLRVYELSENVPATARIYSPDAELEIDVEVVRNGKTVTITVNEALKNFSLCLVNSPAHGKNCEILGNDTIILPAGKGSFTVELE